jgi:hypothetical protein
MNRYLKIANAYWVSVLAHYSYVFLLIMSLYIIVKELDGPAVSALRQAITEVKQRWLIMRWVSKNSLS